VAKHIKKLFAAVSRVSPSAVMLDETETVQNWRVLAGRITAKYDPSGHAQLKECNNNARWKLEKILDRWGATGFPARRPWSSGEQVILFWLHLVRPVACVIPAEELSFEFRTYGHGTIATHYPPASAKVLLYDLNDDETQPMHLKL
jgi:hypothetical protein